MWNSQAINIEGLSLDKFLEHQVANTGWAIEKSQGRGQLIVLPRNEFNDPVLKKNSADGVPLEHITRIFPILSWFFCGGLFKRRYADLRLIAPKSYIAPSPWMLQFEN